jgi:hypothetical protein
MLSRVNHKGTKSWPFCGFQTRRERFPDTAA